MHTHQHTHTWCIRTILPDKYIYAKQGIYHLDVAKELKACITKCGRRYSRYPPQFEVFGEADPGTDAIIRYHITTCVHWCSQVIVWVYMKVFNGLYLTVGV